MVAVYNHTRAIGEVSGSGMIPEFLTRHCPRCNRCWWRYDAEREVSAYDAECVCGMQSYMDGMAEVLCFDFGPMAIGWHLQKHQCVYVKDWKAPKKKGIVIPWLPFTITQAQLDKYLIIL